MEKRGILRAEAGGDGNIQLAAGEDAGSLAIHLLVPQLVKGSEPAGRLARGWHSDAGTRR